MARCLEARLELVRPEAAGGGEEGGRRGMWGGRQEGREAGWG
jgi:hypothetical protein